MRWKVRFGTGERGSFCWLSLLEVCPSSERGKGWIFSQLTLFVLNHMCNGKMLGYGRNSLKLFWFDWILFARSRLVFFSRIYSKWMPKRWNNYINPNWVECFCMLSVFKLRSRRKSVQDAFSRSGGDRNISTVAAMMWLLDCCCCCCVVICYSKRMWKRPVDGHTYTHTHIHTHIYIHTSMWKPVSLEIVLTE